jgi:hypothetical protein
MSPDHLIEYWSALDGQTVHPADRETLPLEQFATSLQPLPWNGLLRSARAYILMLNPGVPRDGTTRDYEYEQRREFHEALRSNLRGDSPYLYRQSRFADHPGYSWAGEWLGSDISEAEANKICVMQLVAYHSKDNKPARRAARHLASCQESIRFVREWLVPRAKEGEIKLIVARAAKLWACLPQTSANPSSFISSQSTEGRFKRRPRAAESCFVG